MRSDIETLKIIANGNFSDLIKGLNSESADIVKAKLNQIPDYFFEPRFKVNSATNERISLIDFSLKTLAMSEEQRKGLMDKYSISVYDMNKLQAILSSIKVASEYGSAQEFERDDEKKSESRPYGIALATSENLDKAYPLWLAYLYSDSKNPFQDVKARLERDGMEKRYKPEYIVSLIEHTNSLMDGKTESEKKDFYMHSISGILDETDEIPVSSSKNAKNQIDIDR